MLEKNLKRRIFFVTGELSGDKTASWFVKKIVDKNIYFQAVGGDFLSTCGVDIYQRFEDLNIVGIVEVLLHFPKIFRIMANIVNHIKVNKFDEVILVDFPGFNLMLAKKLKTEIPNIKITYLAPPQLWCWGSWRVSKIKKYCDRVIVLYPFEVHWYAEHGVVAEWIGNPVYDDMSKYFSNDVVKENVIALIPGSRVSEIRRFMPFLADLVKLFLNRYPDVRFVIPIAESLSKDFFMAEMCRVGMPLERVRILHAIDKFDELRKCCLAITKPGTVTLELALLGVPAIVFFKISWLTYIIGRIFVRVEFMSLPNILMGSSIYREYIQSDCVASKVFQHACGIYVNFKKNKTEYIENIFNLKEIRSMFSRPPTC